MTIPGQESLRNRLSDAAKRGSLHHAYLFAGPPGLGQIDAALWLAQLANCEAEADRPCGVCKNCHLIAARNHPDITWIVPGEKSKTGKILLEQAQFVRVEVSRRPVIGRRRLVILAPADDLTLEAVNCLLKTLEEPPGYATLVLIASDTVNVPATVLSRCQVVRFQPVAANVLEPFLRDHGASAEQARQLAVLSAGHPGEALRLMREPGLLEERNQALDWLERVAQAAPGDALLLAEELRSGRDDEKPDVNGHLGWAVAWFRDILAVQSEADPEVLLNQDRREWLSFAARRYSTSRARGAIDALIRTRRYLAGNANAGLTLEILVMDLIPEEVAA